MAPVPENFFSRLAAPRPAVRAPRRSRPAHRDARQVEQWLPGPSADSRELAGRPAARVALASPATNR
jgi:hypothetical protein